MNPPPAAEKQILARPARGESAPAGRPLLPKTTGGEKKKWSMSITTAAIMPATAARGKRRTRGQCQCLRIYSRSFRSIVVGAAGLQDQVLDIELQDLVLTDHHKPWVIAPRARAGHRNAVSLRGRRPRHLARSGFPYPGYKCAGCRQRDRRGRAQAFRTTPLL